MSIVFAEEAAVNVIKEGAPLFEEHYREIAWKTDKIPLEPDYDGYLMMEKADRLRCYTARDALGQLVGYSIWFLIRGHLHYRGTHYAHNDIVYISPEHRGGIGIKLLKFSEEQLKDAGIHVLSLHIKTSFNWGPMAERLGYEHTEVGYNKWVGD